MYGGGLNPAELFVGGSVRAGPAGFVCNTIP
jgi:hypothetical protein